MAIELPTSRLTARFNDANEDSGLSEVTKVVSAQTPRTKKTFSRSYNLRVTTVN